MTKRSSPQPPMRLPPTVHFVTVIGLGGIGRLAALELTALGIRRLQLVDNAIVHKRFCRSEGFAAEDVGRPKVEAVAEACHAMSPLLDLQTERTSSIALLDVADLVCCCPGTRRVLQAAAGRVNHSTIVACCTVGEGTVRVSLARGPTGTRELVATPVVAPARRRSSLQVAPPAHLAAIAAGLFVTEVIRFAPESTATRHVQLDVVRRTFRVMGHF